MMYKGVSYQGGDVRIKSLFQKYLGKKTGEKKQRVYVGFMNLEKVYDEVIKEDPWQVPRTHDVGAGVD